MKESGVEVFKYLYHILFSLLLSIQGFYFAAEATFVEDQHHIYAEGEPSAFDLLRSYPKYFKKQLPQATVGVIPYAVKDGEIFVLLGREAKDQTWSDFGVKVTALDVTFTTALIRELYEETAGMIRLSTEQLNTPYTLLLYIHKPGRREILYAFCRVDYHPESEFLSAVRKATEESHEEKDHFRWFSLTEFEAYKAGDSDEYPLRDYFRDDLIHSVCFSVIINKLREKRVKTSD